jgi:hypothetical protein
MEINYIPLQEPKEKENASMDIDVQPAEAKEEMYQRLPISEKFSFHKEGEATSKRFLHLYDASAESMTSALYKKWMRNISNIRAQQFSIKKVSSRTKGMPTTRMTIFSTLQRTSSPQREDTGVTGLSHGIHFTSGESKVY